MKNNNKTKIKKIKKKEKKKSFIYLIENSLIYLFALINLYGFLICFFFFFSFIKQANEKKIIYFCKKLFYRHLREKEKGIEEKTRSQKNICMF